MRCARAERVERRQGRVAAPYNLYEPLRRLVKAHGGEIAGEDFAGEVTLTLIFPVDEVAAFEAGLRELSAGRVEAAWEAGSAPPRP